jgi:hypothetical protein
VPNRRLDRIEELLNDLSKQVADQDESSLRDRFTSPEFSDILEDGIQQSARALSDVRIHRIASLLKNSLTDAELSHLRDKRLLELLGQVNDAELIILQSHTRTARHDPEWVAQHESTLRLRVAFIGSSQADLDEAATHKQYKEHLAQLGLLEARVRLVKGAPEYDSQSGRPKISSYDLTTLGRLFLRRIDVLQDDEL